MNFENYPNYEAFKGKQILAVDYGTKITGLATYCPGREPFPMPYGRLVYKDDESLIADILKVIDDEIIDVVVLGLPLYTDGNESEMTKKVRAFGEQLTEKLGPVELHYQDETLTSREAEDRMLNSPRYNFKVDLKEIDAVAASIILEDFIKREK